MKKFIKNNLLKEENHKYKLFIIATVFYSIIVCISMIFLIYIAIFQNIDIYELRYEPKYKIIKNIEKRDILDKDISSGMKKEYRWKLSDVDKGQNYLVFYVVHQCAEVYLDGELIYSLNLKQNNKIGKTTGSNWIIIPIMQTDEGKKFV